MKRKAAIIGGSGGHWIATHGMRGLRLRLQCPDDAVVKVEQDTGDALEVVGPGLHQLTESNWTMVTIIRCSGPALGFLEGAA